MKRISIITPLYNGSKFVKSTIENAKKLNFNVKKYDYEVELVCVNDKPGDILNFKMPHEIIFKLIENHHNLGIQQSRVNGLKESTGDYIIFLDQDDELIVDNYISQLNKIKSADIVVGNLYIDFNNKKKKVFRNRKAMVDAIKEKTLLEYVNMITSPGQCLIRRNIIPVDWINSIMKINGADDLLLWLLLYDKGARFAVNEEIVYYHKTTFLGNLSSNSQAMFSSEKELIQILEKIGYPSEKIDILQKTFILNHNLKLYDLWNLRLTIIRKIFYSIKFRLINKF